MSGDSAWWVYFGAFGFMMGTMTANLFYIAAVLRRIESRGRL